MGRGRQQSASLLYGSPKRVDVGNLNLRVDRRLRRLGDALAGLDIYFEDPDSVVVADLEHLLINSHVPAGSPVESLSDYALWLKVQLDGVTSAEAGAPSADQARYVDLLDHGRILLARAGHRLSGELGRDALASYIRADLNQGEGWRSLVSPLNALMEQTALEHRTWPEVYKRTIEDWGKSGLKRAPSGKYATHYCSADRRGAGACGSRLGDSPESFWKVVADGSELVTCSRCLQVASARPSAIRAITENPERQLVRLLPKVAEKATLVLADEVRTPIIPAATVDFVETVRGAAWDAIIAELARACEEAGHPIGNRTRQCLRRIWDGREELGEQAENVPAISF